MSIAQSLILVGMARACPLLNAVLRALIGATLIPEEEHESRHVSVMLVREQ